MGFPLKCQVEKKEDGAIGLWPAEKKRNRLNLSCILVRYDGNNLEIKLFPYTKAMEPTSIIHTIINNFQNKNSNYADLYEGFDDRYSVETSDYEISNEQVNEILYDFINALDEELNIAPKPLQQFIDLLIKAGYQPPAGANTNIAQLSSPGLSLFDQKKATPATSVDEAEHKTIIAGEKSRAC